MKNIYKDTHTVHSKCTFYSFWRGLSQLPNATPPPIPGGGVEGLGRRGEVDGGRLGDVGRGAHRCVGLQAADAGAGAQPLGPAACGWGEGDPASAI